MSGLYLHIPFCKRKCDYCAFYSGRATEEKISAYIDALLAFISAHADFAPVDTVYIGGGTPSVLPKSEFDRLLRGLGESGFLPAKEVTVELNPESTSESLLALLKQNGVNRLSFGVQSLNDRELQTVGRLHTAREALRAIERSQNAGFDNISADLIYGLPLQTDQTLMDSVKGLVQSGVQHISCYGLQIEEGTPLQKRGTETDDEVQARQYELICDALRDAGFVHYEISSFCKEGYASRHNSSYWDGTPYLGLGAAAHSFVDNKRCAFLPDTDRFIQKATKGDFSFDEIIPISAAEQREEQVMLSLRTSRGVDIGEISGYEKYLQSGHATLQNGRFILTEKGFLVSNYIIADLL